MIGCGLLLIVPDVGWAPGFAVMVLAVSLLHLRPHPSGPSGRRPAP
ncbi:hypothetical protein [Frankia sp. R82]|nr:hypothetical protein [Frankia sp. R82]MCM3883576.1 hypothetical protein [Frankia sp. R82]